MNVKIDGEPDDIIKRCDSCRHCIFEDLLSDEQRKIKVLKGENPEKHIHRGVIEQLCKKHYDGVCPMKYAAMKAKVDDRTATQIAVVQTYIWDMGKRYQQEISNELAGEKWTMAQNLGRGILESRASRFHDIWNRGIRHIVIDDELIENQVFTADFIYEIIMTPAEDYDTWLIMLDNLTAEHKSRDKDGA